MLNYRIIAKAIGGLLILESALMAVCCTVGYMYGEDSPSQLLAWGIPVALTLAIGTALALVGRGAQKSFARRDGYLVVSATWIIFSAFGMLPFLFTHSTDRVALAFFEAMSGFTTTGASAFDDIDALPHSILMWRSLSHWIGGMGIVFFTLAVLPALGIGEQKLFAAEATGVKISKLHPRISTTAHWLWSLYFLLTGSCIGAYCLCGMNIFDAVNHGFSTIATGGFSTHTDSIEWFHSSLIEYVSATFMLLASINFALLYLLLIRGRFRQVLKDEELRLFLCVLIGAIFIIGLCRFFKGGHDIMESFRIAYFTTISLASTTGFTTADFSQWHPIAWITITIVSVIGGCSGSTSGGIKVVRPLLAWKVIRCEFKKILHPRAVLPIRLNGSAVEPNVISTVVAYTFLYILLVVGGTAAMILLGLSATDAIGLAISAFSNIGPTIGHDIGPLTSWGCLPDSILWINSFLMLAGRLEVFSLLLPLIPAFWRER